MQTSQLAPQMPHTWMPDMEKGLLIGHFWGRNTNQKVHLLEGSQVQILGAGIRNWTHVGEELLSHGQLEGPDVVGLQVVTWNQSPHKGEMHPRAEGQHPGPLLGNPAVGPCLVHRVIKGGSHHLSSAYSGLCTFHTIRNLIKKGWTVLREHRGSDLLYLKGDKDSIARKLTLRQDFGRGCEFSGREGDHHSSSGTQDT